MFGFGFKSATDCPRRDPDEVTISIQSLNSNGKYDFVELGTVLLDFSQKRNHTISFNGIRAFTNAFVFEFVNNKGNREI